MISRFLLWLIGDLIAAKDGSISLTRLAATTAHFSMFNMVVYITYSEGFKWDMWAMYIGATIFHATYDKTTAMLKDFKEKTLPKGAPNA